MPRARKEPRLYLDTKRRQWIIRDGKEFIRTGVAEESRDQAELVLERYLVGEMPTTEGERVYFIRAHNRIKIGRAIDVQRRFATLQASSPVKLKLLWSQEGGSEIERSFHKKFEICRVHGEWFDIKGPLEEFLQRYRIR